MSNPSPPPPSSGATTEPAQPVVPKPAASLLVLRDAGTPQVLPKVLMGMRGSRHKFMPNRLVFPGGRVDPEDHVATVATPLRPHVRGMLLRAADAALAHAVGIAAARELEEETGLTLGLPPLLHGLDYLCRAITPENSPMRFDAHFLVVDAAHVAGDLAGSGELEDLSWYSLDEALSRCSPPTNQVLDQLMLWLAMDEAARTTRTLVPTLRNRGWELE